MVKPMAKFTRIVCFAVLLPALVFPRPGSFLFAGSITLSAQTEGVLSNAQVKVRSTIHNSGSETARDIFFSIPEGEVLPGAIAALEPGDSRLLETSFDLPGAHSPGGHAVRLMLHYHDRAGRRFSTPQVMLFEVEGDDAFPTPSRLALAANPVRLRRRGTLRIVAASLDGRPLPVRLSLALPDEIKGPGQPVDWTVHPSGSALELPLENLSASEGSRYPLTVIAEFERDGRQQAVTATTGISLERELDWSAFWRPFWLSASLLALGFALYRRRDAAPPSVTSCRATELLLVAAATLVVLWQVAPPELLHDTTTVGGDLVAHNYIVEQLRQNLSRHGRVVFWAPGWWGGFPLFQFYFPLPYLLILLLDLLMPANVAFKLATITGLVATPAAAWLAARRMGLPRPLPGLLGMATLPLLLDTTHTMWGVNAYSTLAGMIANSFSFALMLPALGYAFADARDGRPRFVTLLLLCGVVFSHFFTALVLALLLVIAPFLPGINRRRAISALLPLGLLTLLLTAGWWLPLMVKRPWSVDFGVNWSVNLWRQLPLALRAGGLPALVAALWWRWRPRGRSPAPPAVKPVAWVLTALLVLASLLFYRGYALNPVFVNVRLWPFMVFSALSLAALGFALLFYRSTAVNAYAWLFGCLVLALAWDHPLHARQWARHNFSGLESRPEARRVFSRLVAPLDGTPGRLAYDLHPGNEALGSSRVFEAVPALFDKPVLEGGLVNSALGSLASYLVQGEISDASAGFPPIVRPREFAPDAATLHLVWMNVSHFIARSPRTRQALADSPWWRQERTEADWTLFESLAHDGSRVRVLDRSPTPVVVEDLQRELLEWLYVPGAVRQPFVYLPPGMSPPPSGPAPVSSARYRELLAGQADLPLPSPDSLFDSSPVRREEFASGLIRFTTSAPGRPHLLAETWFPNWHAVGADGPYPVSPSFMLVYPHREEVELRYADLPVDRAARLAALAGWLLTPPVWWWLRRRRLVEES